MQISKCLLTVCAAVSVLSVRAGDNQAQIKAREALEKAMNQPGQAPQAAPANAPVMQAPPAAPQIVTPTPADSDAIARAREALEQKLNQPQSQPPAPAPVVVQPPPAPKRRPKPQMAAPAPTAVETPAAPTLNPAPAADADAIAKAREALREKMQTLGSEPVPAPPAPAFAQPPPAAPPVAMAPVQPPSTPAFNSMPEAESADVAKAREAMRTTLDAIPPDASPGKVGLNFPPLQGPPLGISAEKQQKLQNLLQQYKLDLVSPEQYQASRAKILAGP